MKLATAQTKPPASPVKVVRQSINKLHPLVRQRALILAEGNATRIEVVSETEAIVR